jgi:outer membrane protein OmpA-like peptidoglycan-associated protein
MLQNHDYSTLGPGTREVNAVLILDPVEDMPNVVKIRQKVLFDFDSYEMDVVAQSTVAAVAVLMKEHSDTFLVLAGHTDKYGTKEYNDQLSVNRANAVKGALVDKGIDEDRIDAVGYGKSQLLPDLSNRENRRVLILSLDD